MAESSTFLTARADARGVNCSTRRASSTWRPRMRSMTRRALNGETRTNRACALTPRFSWAWAFSDISLVPLSSLTTSAARAASANPGRPLLGAVDAEGPGRRELAELVADHRLGDVHGHVLAPIVDRRDQVLTTRLSRLRFSSSIFFSRWSSTKGPFYSERPIGYRPLPLPRRRRMSLSEGL